MSNNKKRIHLIAIGGAVMHNIAIALQYNHHTVSGSDDEIYNPSKERLARIGLLPKEMGWHPERITKDLDLVILGMHARPDNPELAKAKELGIPIYSFPEYIYQHSKDKTRVVVAGSHGKTTTTSMIMHILKSLDMDFDYLVGAQLEGFDAMVRFSDAPIMIIEGDEYLSSPLDRRPKFLHYKPNIAIITGIAWDHINVFPTFEIYKKQFELFIDTLSAEDHLIYYREDAHLQSILAAQSWAAKTEAYESFAYERVNGRIHLIAAAGEKYPLQIFGKHNLENLKAAHLACRKLGVSDADFYRLIQGFKGAAKRLQILAKSDISVIYQDFAHAPSKVGATINAMYNLYPMRTLVAYLELHTFSSLNKDFLVEYAHKMQAADRAVVYYSKHTLKMKKLPPITKEDIQNAFKHPNMIVLSDEDDFITFVKDNHIPNANVLFMSSGSFGGTDLKALGADLIND